jgi:hypothetical protein
MSPTCFARGERISSDGLLSTRRQPSPPPELPGFMSVTWSGSSARARQRRMTLRTSERRSKSWSSSLEYYRQRPAGWVGRSASVTIRCPVGSGGSVREVTRLLKPQAVDPTSLEPRGRCRFHCRAPSLSPVAVLHASSGGSAQSTQRLGQHVASEGARSARFRDGLPGPAGRWDAGRGSAC